MVETKIRTSDVIVELDAYRTCLRFYDMVGTANSLNGIKLSPDQLYVLASLRDDHFSACIARRAPTFENPTVEISAYRSTTSIDHIPDKIKFGNREYQTELDWETFNQILDAIYGGRATQPELPQGLKDVKKIIDALKEGKRVQLKFYEVLHHKS